jgi:hypothetical protein
MISTVLIKKDKCTMLHNTPLFGKSNLGNSLYYKELRMSRPRIELRTRRLRDHFLAITSLYIMLSLIVIVCQ